MKKFFEMFADALVRGRVTDDPVMMRVLGEGELVDGSIAVTKCEDALVNLVGAIERGEPSELVLDRADDLRDAIDEAIDALLAVKTQVVKGYASDHGREVVEVKAGKPKPLSLVRSREELMESLRASRELLAFGKED